MSFNVNTGVAVVSIPEGQSVSPEIDLADNDWFAVAIPSNWPSDTALSFMASPYGANDQLVGRGNPRYQSLFDDTGAEVSLTAAPGTVVTVSSASFRQALQGLRFIKLVVGTNESPVNVSADTQVSVVLKRAG
jgi:hypothetical protein